HVAPPVERAFANLNRMLKPDGLLLFTVPYRIEGRTAEHFPQLHEYALAAPGGRTVLVNRCRDGSLKVILAAAGFGGVQIASENVPEFGVLHGETWSLPMVGRKGTFQPPAAEI